MDDGVDFETKKKAFAWCREYLGGSWLEIDFKDFQIRNMHGGLSNTHYVCSLPAPPAISATVNLPALPTSGRSGFESSDRDIAGLTNYIYECTLPESVSSASSPRQVLLRVFGEIFIEGDTPLLDTVIFTLLSERSHSPHLYGVFPEGRLEEFIPSRALRTDELSQPEMSVAIARKLAVFHQLQLPLCKMPRWIDDILTRWSDAVSRVSVAHVQNKEVFEKVAQIDIAKEVKFLTKLVSETSSPVVFSHNDCQEGNILYVNNRGETLEENLVLIDYEYASYNYFAYDLANHFNEWTMNYNIDQTPYYKITKEDFPSREQQIAFLKAYDEKCKELGALPDELGSYDDRLREVQRFVVVNHFIWAMWSVIQAKVSKTTFGFEEYAWDRFSLYFDWKRKLPADMLQAVKS